MARKQPRNSNPKIASQTLVRSQPEGTVSREEVKDEVYQKRLDAKIERKKELVTLPEILAQHKFYYRDWLWDQDRKSFPFDPELRHVELYFPYAEGGPLLIDQPTNKQEQEECNKKKDKVLDKGFRYLAIHQKMDINKAMEALDSLGGKHGMGHTARRS